MLQKISARRAVYAEGPCAPAGLGGLLSRLRLPERHDAHCVAAPCYVPAMSGPLVDQPCRLGFLDRSRQFV
ncbi:MAG: hypothetical protein ACYTE3_24925, partial [Planctomycetota bacterium]